MLKYNNIQIPKEKRITQREEKYERERFTQTWKTLPKDNKEIPTKEVNINYPMHNII